MTFFILLASLLSTFLSELFLWFLIYPLGLLSFPFYSTADKLHSWMPVSAYNIHFLTAKIVTISPQQASSYGFLFFFSINLIGAVVGYRIHKTLPEMSLKRDVFDFFFRSGIISFIACYILFWITFLTVGISLSPMTEFGSSLYSTLQFIFVFYEFLFWIPALVATTIYGIRIRLKSREQPPSN